MGLRTQVGIVGAGPSGLLLSRFLELSGIEAIVLERRSGDYVKARVRAGVLESGSVAILTEAGVGARIKSEGLVHEGTEFSFNGERHRIDFKKLTGKTVTVYGQQDVTRDLMEVQGANRIVYEVDDVALDGFHTSQPRIRYLKDGVETEIDCDFIIGCDGFRGVSRRSIPADAIRTYERVFDFGWMGVLSATKPVSDELIYANHERGFALCSMRSEQLSRVYIQVPATDSPDNWPEDKFWDEVRSRLDPEAAARMETGPAIEKSFAAARSFVAEPMRFGRLFIAGDAAHIVPPTGAKGLNLAFADIRFLFEALTDHYRTKSDAGLDAYSARCLARIWKAQRFSVWMTSMFHLFPETGAFGRKLQLAELEWLVHSEAGMKALAENYVGLPFT